MRKKGEYLLVSDFNAIVYPVAQTMARNSRKLPSIGFGASLLGLLAKVSHKTPVTAVRAPKYALLLTLSLRNNPAVIMTRIGSMAVIIPAWEAVVFSIAFASKMK